MSATVTVVVRTRNRPAMLTRALASIASQTFDDYEVVIVNDAGDEAGVREIVKKQKSAVRSKITIVTNEVSNGREAALESGLAASHNRYYAVHDDDDSWHPHFLKKTVAYLDEHPQEGGVATRCEIVRERVRADGTCIEIEREVLSTDNYGLSLVDMLVENYTPPISQLIRREVADRVGHWDGSLQTQADWDFNLRLLADSPVGFVDGEPLAYWHHRDTMDASLGNSIVTDAYLHKWDNLHIRDRYLRTMLATEDPSSPHLGQALLSAEYYRRVREEMARVESSYHGALNLVHIDMLNTMTALHQQVHELREEVTSLREELAAGSQLKRSVRSAASKSKRAAKKLMGRS